MREQLAVVLRKVSALEMKVAGLPNMHINQVQYNQGLKDDIKKLGSQLVFADSEAEVAHTLVNKLADSMASKSADVANKSMEMAQRYQTELRVSTLPGNHNGQTVSVPTIEDTCRRTASSWLVSLPVVRDCIFT